MSPSKPGFASQDRAACAASQVSRAIAPAIRRFIILGPKRARREPGAVEPENQAMLCPGSRRNTAHLIKRASASAALALCQNIIGADPAAPAPILDLEPARCPFPRGHAGIFGYKADLVAVGPIAEVEHVRGRRGTSRQCLRESAEVLSRCAVRRPFDGADITAPWGRAVPT